MTLKNRVAKLETSAPNEKTDPIKLGWFDPDDEKVTGFKDDDEVATMRDVGESLEDLRQRAIDNSLWVEGPWHESDSIY